MGGKHGLEPSSDHCVCVVDMLGRVAELHEAHNFLHKKGLESTSVAQTTLLNACCVHGNGKIGEIAAEKLQVWEPDNDQSYLAISSVYSRTGRVEESRRLLDLMRSKDLRILGSVGSLKDDAEIKHSVFCLLDSLTGNIVLDLVHSVQKVLTFIFLDNIQVSKSIITMSVNYQ